MNEDFLETVKLWTDESLDFEITLKKRQLVYFRKNGPISSYRAIQQILIVCQQEMIRRILDNDRFT